MQEDIEIILYPRPFESDKRPTQISISDLREVLAQDLDEDQLAYRIKIGEVIKSAEEWQKTLIFEDLSNLQKILVPNS